MKLLSVFGAIMKMVRLGLRWWIVRQAKRQLAVVKDGIEPCRLNVERHSDRREKPVSQMVHRIDIPERHIIWIAQLVGAVNGASRQARAPPSRTLGEVFEQGNCQ
jgi:hypothetical protein